MVSSSMPWVKLYTEMLDDPKIGRLSPALRWRFIELILIAGECDADGYLIGMSLQDIAWRLRTSDEELQKNLDLLAAVGLIQLDGDTWLVINFAKRQGRPQSVKRQQWHEAQNRRRDARDDSQDDFREYSDKGGNTVINDTDLTPNVVITPEKIRVDQDQEEDKRRSISAQAPKQTEKPARVRKTSDPRSKHPAILCALGVARHYPPLEIYDDVINILGEHPDGAKLAECRKEWVKRGYNSGSWNWLLEWYPGMISTRNGSKPSATPPPEDSLAAEIARRKAKFANGK